jgi:hypothetical protein
MGGRLFDLRGDGSTVQIIAKPASLPPKPLLEGVARDIQHLFDPAPLSDPRLVQREGGEVVLESGDARRLLEWSFDAEGESGVPGRSAEIARGRIVREVTYGEPRAFPGFEHPAPTRIRLWNHQWRYRLDIELLDARPTIPRESGAGS